MGDGEDEAAFEQAQAGVGEPGIEAMPVGAVAIEIERRGAPGGDAVEDFLARHQADRHLRAVAAAGPDAPTGVGVGVEGAFHRGLLEDGLRAIGEVQLAYLRRTVQGLVAQSHAGAVEFQAVLHVEAVGGVRQLHAVGRQALRLHLDHRQAAVAQAEDHRLGVQADIFQGPLRVVGHAQLPVLASRPRLLGLVEGEVDPRLVAADQPQAPAVEATVVGVVLMAFLARRQAAERSLRLVGVEHPGLAGGLAVEQEDQLAFRAGAVAVQEEAPVAFLEYQLGAGLAQAVAIELVRAVGVVQFAEEQRTVIVGPGQAAIAVVEGQGLHRAAGEVLDEQAVDLVAAGVQAVGQQALVGADAEGAEGEEAAVGQLVGIEQQLLGAFVDRQAAVRRTWAAVVARVFIAGGGALVVQPRTPGTGQRQVGLADASPDLLEQGLAQPGLVGQFAIQVGVLGLQVVEHLRGVALLQPGVGVASGVAAGDGGLRMGHRESSSVRPCARPGNLNKTGGAAPVIGG